MLWNHRWLIYWPSILGTFCVFQLHNKKYIITKFKSSLKPAILECETETEHQIQRINRSFKQSLLSIPPDLYSKWSWRMFWWHPCRSRRGSLRGWPQTDGRSLAYTRHTKLLPRCSAMHKQNQAHMYTICRERLRFLVVEKQTHPYLAAAGSAAGADSSSVITLRAFCRRSETKKVDLRDLHIPEQWPHATKPTGNHYTAPERSFCSLNHTQTQMFGKWNSRGTHLPFGRRGLPW